MAATREVTIWCDHRADPDGPTCGQWGQGNPIPGTARSARADLRRRGWRYVPGHPTTGPARDLCPTHAKEANCG